MEERARCRAIARALERKNKTDVERIAGPHGGIGPARRRRAFASLRPEEREENSRGIAVGRSTGKSPRARTSAIDRAGRPAQRRQSGPSCKLG